MGLIYVNPGGSGRSHETRWPRPMIYATPLAGGMNDEETVALIAGGHTLGKTHGAHKPG
ncbi:MAG: hypothetical protein R3E50_14650 [Halioglobus sp.]